MEYADRMVSLPVDSWRRLDELAAWHTKQDDLPEHLPLTYNDCISVAVEEYFDLPENNQDEK